MATSGEINDYGWEIMGNLREPYELIRDSVPSVVPQPSKARPKLKPNLERCVPSTRPVDLIVRERWGM